MTREEARQQFKNVSFDCNRRDNDKVLLLSNAKDVIDFIYDDFEKQICENCKHWKQYEEADFGKCVNKEIVEDFLDTEGECDELNYYNCYPVFEPTKDFSCNRFERKN